MQMSYNNYLYIKIMLTY